MIRHIYRLYTIFLVTGYLVFVSAPISAQVPVPELLLEDVIARYQDTMAAEFIHTTTSEIWEGTQTLTGEVKLWGDRYRIETFNEIITGQGDEAWIYRPNDNQILVTKIDGDGVAYSPLALFRSYDELYRPLSSTREIFDGASHFRLDLSPIQEDFTISSLTLWIRESDQMITRIVTLDESLTQTEIQLNNIRVGIPIPPETFEFIPPEGVEVIDLRS